MNRIGTSKHRRTIGAAAAAFGLAALALVGIGSDQILGASSEAVSPAQVIKISATEGGLPQQAINAIAALDNVADIRPSLALGDGETRIIGVDPSRPVLMEVEGKLVTPSPVEGRLLEAGDAGRGVIVVGKSFAQTRKTGFGYPILGMAAHQPPFFLGENEVTILGVYETGSAQANEWVLLPLSTVQQLYGKPGQVNQAYVVVEDAAKRSSTVDNVKKIVGTGAAVLPLGG
jgi:ABC-type lipoprotein release transport system permease subunit